MVATQCIAEPCSYHNAWLFFSMAFGNRYSYIVAWSTYNYNTMLEGLGI